MAKSSTGGTFLDDATKLYEIAKLPEEDWCWLHDYIVQHDLSKQQVIDVVKGIRLFREKTAAIADLIDVHPSKIAHEIATVGTARTLADVTKYAEKVSQTLATLTPQQAATFYDFDALTDTIRETAVDLLARLRELLQQAERTVNAVNQCYKAILEELKAHSREHAETSRRYYQESRNRAELAELQRIETETRQAIVDAWIDLTPNAAIAAQTGKSAAEVDQIISAYRHTYGLTGLVAECTTFQAFGATLADASVDAIVTDPPYPKEFLPLYAEFAAMAARVLKPGGSCFVMCGQSYLPEIFAMLGAHLRYHWLLAYLTPGGQAVQLWDRNVNTFYKPILWYVNGDYTGKWLGDVAKSAVNDNDKRFHEWGQSESGMVDLVERCTEPGQLVFDPFMGAGTTGIACKATGRGFLGVDTNEEYVKIARRRLYGE